MAGSVFSEDIVANYIIQVNLVFRKGVINRLGSFNVWKKGGTFGKADELMKFCSATKCLGTFSDSFVLTPKEVVRNQAEMGLKLCISYILINYHI